MGGVAERIRGIFERRLIAVDNHKRLSFEALTRMSARGTFQPSAGRKVDGSQYDIAL
ncbi:hypothetical protein MES5069_270072 [Mesorhizobium escarrei]|uniref:Uncharacterized protein n=1 Tax=Mesorhizobium escarrei TaxID=666018 RepID=A0ABM9DVT9_9HYPH|nr:hypothetical protein MES5069_270072 [Mesorhizobium escarrei]